jgi:hypothetical protein
MLFSTFGDNYYIDLDKLEKEIEYKNGQVNTWYYIKLEEEDGSSQFIDLVKDDEEKASELLESASKNWVPHSKTIIKEVIVD